jgi:uncharacterized membrane protein
LVDAAALYKDHHGISSLQETRDVDAWRGALAGALAGALVGLIGGPPGAIIGAAAGAATGGIAADKLDQGFSDAFLKDLRAALQPGTSAVLVIIDEQWKDALLHALEEHPGKLLRHALRSDLVTQLKEAQSRK